MGSAITAISFLFFYERGLAGSSYGKEKEDHNPLDCFRIEIIEEIISFSLTWKTQPVVKKL